VQPGDAQVGVARRLDPLAGELLADPVEPTKVAGGRLSRVWAKRTKSSTSTEAASYLWGATTPKLLYSS
jgi:hypothetical protein